MSCRSLLVILLILAISGMNIRQFTDKSTIIFAVDLSASMNGTEAQAVNFIKQAELLKGTKEDIGILCFGENASIEKMPDSKNKLAGFNSYIDADFTDISEALKLSQTLMPENTKKKVVLISDGVENIGSSFEQAKLMKEQNITLEAFPIQNEISKEVQVTEIKVPKFINKNAQYDIQVTVDSLVDTKADLKIFKNNALLSLENVTVRKGENKFVYADNAEEGGGNIYRAEIEATDDTFSENNISYAYSYIEDVPKILVIEHNQSAGELIKLLESAKLNVTTVESNAVPTSIDKISIYDAVMMADVPIEELPENFPDLIEAYVKNTGGGLFVTGGENSYALGGYYKTPIETVLPVSMELKDKSNLPNLGLIIVTDRSGSMSEAKYGVSKLELAKESAIRSIDSLNDIDSVGVIAFDDMPNWAVEFQKVGENKESIKTGITGINLGGGTSILPGLAEAFETLKNADTKLKHIILLTDGQAEQSGYDSLINSMKEYGITLSTIAVGSGSDRKLLKYLSEQGNGRYYYTDEFTDLPKIFTKETILAGKTYLNNTMFYPKASDFSQILIGIEQIPALFGFVATTKKDRADLILKTDNDEPILASWQYGLGRSVAWTSDVNGHWTSNWLKSTEGVQIFKNVISFITRKQSTTNVAIEAEIKGKVSELTLKIPFSEGIKNIKATVLGPDLSENEIQFVSDTPETYKAEIQSNKSGAYVLNLELDKDTIKENINTGIVIPYSKEYNIKNYSSGMPLMNKLTQITNGKILKDPKQIFEKNLNKVYSDNNISDILLYCALILFLFDIAIRRFSIISEKLETFVANIIVKLKFRKKEKKKVMVKMEQPSTPIPNIKINLEKEPVKINNTSNLLVQQKRKRDGR